MPSVTIQPTLGGRTGYTESGADQSAWDAAKDAVTGDALVTADSSLLESSGWTNGSAMVCRRVFYTFQIPSDIEGIITSATFKVGYLIYNGPVRIVGGQRTDFHVAITVEDYDQVDFNTAYSDSSVQGSGGYYNIDLNQTGINFLNGEGVTGANRELVFVSDNDYTDTLPTDTSNIAAFYARNHSTHYPRLIINYMGLDNKILAGTTHIGSNATIHI